MSHKLVSPAITTLLQDVLGDKISNVEQVERGLDGDKYIVTNSADEKFFCRVKKVAETEELPYQENEVLMATDSAHVIKPVRAETLRGSYVIIRPYIEGRSLTDRLKEGPLTDLELQQLANTLIDCAESLQRAGAVHFDIKPDNIVAASDGAFYLIDFGAARMLERMKSERIRPARKYIPPEVLNYLFHSTDLALRRLSIMADMYGIGAVLYECLTGIQISQAFQRSSDILHKLPAPVLSVNSKANPQLAALADRLLGKDPSTRLLPKEARALLEGQIPAPVRFPRFLLKTISGAGNEHTGMLSTIAEDGNQVGLYFHCSKTPLFRQKTFCRGFSGNRSQFHR